MRNFDLHIKLDSDVFEPDPVPELAALLHKLANDIMDEGIGVTGTIVSSNNEVIGTYDTRG